MRILVTGGAGFIGSHLIDRIAREDPREIIVVDDLSLGAHANLEDAASALPGKIRLCEADAADRRAMERIIGSSVIDVLFGLAVVPLPASLREPERAIATNVALALTSCELVREGRALALVHVSSSEVYGSARLVPMTEDHPTKPLTPYAASKLAGDHIALSYASTFGIDVTVARPFNNYGPRQNAGPYAGVVPVMIRQALQGGTITIDGDGEQTRDFVFVRDTADAIVRLYEETRARRCVVNIASGRETSVNRLTTEILRIAGSRSPIVHRPPRPADVSRHIADIAQARELIAFAPVVSLEAGLSETIDWYRARMP